VADDGQDLPVPHCNWGSRPESREEQYRQAHREEWSGHDGHDGGVDHTVPTGLNHPGVQLVIHRLAERRRRAIPSVEQRQLTDVGVQHYCRAPNSDEKSQCDYSDDAWRTGERFECGSGGEQDAADASQQ
jgi:hypothetical protein